MKTIGILGAGQLGRMLALAGYPLGMRFRFFDPAADSPAGHLAPHVVAKYDDWDALKAFAESVDVVTYEFENVPVETARFLEQYVPVNPPPVALEKGQDRLVEKTFFQSLGIPIPKFASDEEISGDFGFPAVLKTRRMGYDGKGQVAVNGEKELLDAIEQLQNQDLILEEYIKFDREVSIIGVRSKSGETAFYPLAENTHREGILRLSLIREGISPLQAQAESYAKSVMEALGYVGILAIEFFEKNGQLLANEMAPRVHNSGHWTIDGAITSQFENHVRAVCDLPLGSTNPLGVCAMINLVGQIPEPASILKIEGAYLHLYGKSPRPGRKVGHINVVCARYRELLEKLEMVSNLVKA